MKALINGTRARVQILAGFVGSIWVVSLIGFLFNWHLGVVPRTAWGLLGMAPAPWFHANTAHLLSNTLPLLVLGWMVLLPRTSDFGEAVLGSMIGAGAAAWLLGGSHTLHFGASGLVFGFFGYVLARGIYQRRLLELALAGAATLVYGLSMFIGLLPVFPGVSWQSHLGGAVGGFLVAKLAKEA